jgi:hypothetical protein
MFCLSIIIQNVFLGWKSSIQVRWALKVSASRNLTESFPFIRIRTPADKPPLRYKTLTETGILQALDRNGTRECHSHFSSIRFDVYTHMPSSRVPFPFLTHTSIPCLHFCAFHALQRQLQERFVLSSAKVGGKASLSSVCLCASVSLCACVLCLCVCVCMCIFVCACVNAFTRESFPALMSSPSRRSVFPQNQALSRPRPDQLPLSLALLALHPQSSLRL